jgi:hypothetical protein
MSDSTSASTTLASFKDLSLAFLSSGLDGIRELSASKSTHKKAIQYLKETGRDVADYESYLADVSVTRNGAPNSGRGRPAPKVGSSRIYKAQKAPNTGPFIRLPLETIGCDKGQSVRVEFESDRIVVVLLSSSKEDSAET